MVLRTAFRIFFLKSFSSLFEREREGRREERRGVEREKGNKGERR